MEKETEKLARMIRYIVYGVIGAIIFVFLIALYPVSDSPYPDTEVKTVPGKAELVLDNLEVSGTHATIDTVGVEFNNITLKNIGDSSFGGYNGNEIILKVVVNNKSKSTHTYMTIPPGETRSPPPAYISDLSLEIERQPGEFEFSGNIIIENESEEILDRKNFSFSIPSAEIGDTVVLEKYGNKFDMRLNSWYVDRDYSDEYKCVVLKVTIKNNYQNKQVKTPSIVASVISKEGYVQYKGWTGGYCRDSSPLSYEYLFPNEETTGEIGVGIPKDWEPVEMSLAYLNEIIKLD